MSVVRLIAAVILSRVQYVLSNAWTVGPSVLVGLSLTALVAAAATYLAEHGERHAFELQQRFKVAVSALPNGRQVDRSLRVIRPPSLAALLIPGEERSLPAAWDVGPATAEALSPYLETSPSGPAGASADAATFVGQFGGVLALAFGLLSVLRERRRGWQDVERATIVPPSALIFAQLVSATLALAAVVGLWFLAIDFAVTQVDTLDWPVARETLWELAPAVWLYTLTLYGYGAGIAWLFKDPVRAVATTAVVWLALVLLGPQVTTALSASAAPLQSRSRSEEERRVEHTDFVRAMETEVADRIGPQIDPALVLPEDDNRFFALFREMEPFWLKGIADARARADDLEQAWSQQAESFRKRRQDASRLTPTTLLPQVLAEVIGTGHLTRTRWEGAVHDYKKRLNQALFDNRPDVPISMQVGERRVTNNYRRHPSLRVFELPAFEPPQIFRSERWRAARGDMVALALHAAFGLSFAAFAQRRTWRRYDFVLSTAGIGTP